MSRKYFFSYHFVGDGDAVQLEFIRDRLDGSPNTTIVRPLNVVSRGSSSSAPINLMFKIRPFSGYVIDSVVSGDNYLTWNGMPDGSFQSDWWLADDMFEDNSIPPDTIVTTRFVGTGGGGEPDTNFRYVVIGQPDHVLVRQWDSIDHSWSTKQLNTINSLDVAYSTGAELNITAKSGFELTSVDSDGIPLPDISGVGLYDGTVRYIVTTSDVEAPPPPAEILRFKVNGDATQIKLRMYDPSEYSWVTKALNTEHTIDVADASDTELSIVANAGFELVSASGGGLTIVDGNIDVSDLSLYNDELRVVETVSKDEGVDVDVCKFRVEGSSLDSTLELFSYRGSVPTKLEDLELNTTYEYPKLTDGSNYRLVVTPTPGATIQSVVCDRARYDDESYGYIWRWSDLTSYWRINLDENAYYDNILATTTISSIPATPDVISPFNNIWNMDREALVDLSNSMYMVGGGGPGESGIKYEDSKFVLNLLSVPFELPVDVIGDLTNIKIGKTLTDIQSPILTSDRIKIELGDITVTGLGDSSIDYLNSKFELVLPFSGNTVELEPSEVIGKVITVEYELDVYKGDITVNVFNGGLEPISSTTDKVGRDIPIHLFKDVVGSVGSYLTTNNGIYSAFIRVSRGELSTGMYDNLIRVDGLVGDYSGYVEVVNADLKGVVDSEIVLGILKGGVVIR